MIVQPVNRGTLPAIPWGLLRIARFDKDALVALCPSDHYYADEEEFITGVASAFVCAEKDILRVILLGAPAKHAETEYGWIEPDSSLSTDFDGRLMGVKRFWEKPSYELAKRLLNQGCFWNTFVMVGTVRAFLELIRRACPGLYSSFEPILSFPRFDLVYEFVRSLYDQIPSGDFSKEVLSVNTAAFAVASLGDSGWSDLGDPRRLITTLHARGIENPWVDGGRAITAAPRWVRVEGAVPCACGSERNRRKEQNMTTAANWPTFMSHLVERHEVAENTMAFQFDKPVGWTFKPGKFVDITLINPPETDSEGNTRGFSISSAPHEPMIMVTTRLRDTAFKRVLKNVSLGSEVKIEGPFGNLTIHNNAARPAVFLAGGIGITPFWSIVVTAAREKLPHHIFLFYSNRRPEDAAFLDELQNLEAENPNYKLIATMTDMEKPSRPWTGEVGMIDHNMLDRYLKAAASPQSSSAGPIYYGPPQMDRDLQATLTRSGIDTDDIRIEEFSGY